MDWFLYNIGLRHERVKIQQILGSREPVPYPDVFWAYGFLEVKDCIV